MELKTYQKQLGLNNVEFASILGIHPSFLTHYYAGRKGFSREMAIAIEKVTKKNVTRTELVFPKHKTIKKSLTRKKLK
jgi:DNA-binding transcriptional regulator YdaS (Cro superfamily)